MRFPCRLWSLFARAMVVDLERRDKTTFVMPGSRIRGFAHGIAGISSCQLLPSPAFDWEVIVKTYQLYINGQYVDPANGEWFESVDPYRGEAWAKIPRGSKADAHK